MTAGSNCISKEEARRFLVKYHGLDGGQGLSGKDGIMRFMNRVGCIQYDPLNVAGRNADLVLQSRIEGYRSRRRRKRGRRRPRPCWESSACCSGGSTPPTS